MKKISLLLFLIVNCFLLTAQLTSIDYESNGKNVNSSADNPFVRFVGEWTLQNDEWIQNWGGETEIIKIPNHHTVSSAINTNNSLLSIIDGPAPNGHIFWSYNPNTHVVSHLSSFGDIRAGEGEGTIDREGNVKLKLSFEGEAPGTYRVYKYQWLNKDCYHMKSVQFGLDDKPTGLFYEGTFIRFEKKSDAGIRTEIENILAVLDNNAITKEELVEVFAEDIVHMAPDNEVITSKSDLLLYLNQQLEYGHAVMNHRIDKIELFKDVIVMTGDVTGKYYPKEGSGSIGFRTKNLFVFKRVDGVLKISKVIFNSAPITK